MYVSVCMKDNKRHIEHQSRQIMKVRKVESKKVYTRKKKHKNGED
jgi:hypothetical protein